MVATSDAPKSGKPCQRRKKAAVDCTAAQAVAAALLASGMGNTVTAVVVCPATVGRPAPRRIAVYNLASVNAYTPPPSAEPADTTWRTLAEVEIRLMHQECPFHAS
jgi:hypothetical protein